jgi:hypothetical protein
MKYVWQLQLVLVGVKVGVCVADSDIVGERVIVLVGVGVGELVVVGVNVGHGTHLLQISV